jgi:hypothetical protein
MTEEFLKPTEFLDYANSKYQRTPLVYDFTQS